MTVSPRQFIALLGRRPGLLAALAVALLGAATAPARAQPHLTINPTYDSTITSDPNAATIMGTINAAIAEYNARFSNPITVNITFQSSGSGLGSSSTVLFQPSYVNYRAALVSHATTPDDATALATLPVQATSPVDGQTNMWMSRANARALGLVGPSSGTDSTITLNTSIMNLDRTSIDSSKYDLKAVAQHEIDEALGLGSGLNLPVGFPRQSEPQDLFRYSAPGVRSYTTSSSATSYFSIDGGATILVQFNQSGGGSDYGDWRTGTHGPAFVQDAFGTPGATPDLGVELRNLDVIGYDLVAVPEPNVLVLAALSACGLAGVCGRYRRGTPPAPEALTR